jgi:hypothetical protein
MLPVSLDCPFLVAPSVFSNTKKKIILKKKDTSNIKFRR